VNERFKDLDQSWLSHLQEEFQLDYMQGLFEYLALEKAKGTIIYPAEGELFSALNCTPLDQVKVVIIGQDPYHGPQQAHGLSFSVQPGIKMPPSLRNIYKELVSDVGCRMPPHGHLLAWAKQGVLMLNSVLTVAAGDAASHQGKGWEYFTDRVVGLVNQKGRRVVFLLWGANAQKKGESVDRSRHLVLSAPHPSPLSAYRGFFGCGHFSKTNKYLEANGLSPIDWQIT